MEPVDLFYSYAHEDEALRDELAGHLKIMERRGVLRSWHDRAISPGQKWDQAIHERLSTADLVLLLISVDFIASDYIWGNELKVAMERERSGAARVVPVMLRAVDIEEAPFADLQGLPTDLRPVTLWTNRDEAWTNVAKGIRRTVNEIQDRQAGTRSLDELGAPRSAGLDDTGVWPRPSEDALGDPLLDRVVDDYTTELAAAAAARGTVPIDRVSARQSALRVIDAPEQKRVLWVDDRPNNNRRELASLAKLQVEVVSVTNTPAALALLTGNDEPFDLVVSDWSRPEPTPDAPSAGIDLLRKLRHQDVLVPVVFYHGEFDESRRRARSTLALADGAAGEAVRPDELFALIASSLTTS